MILNFNLVKLTLNYLLLILFVGNIQNMSLRRFKKSVNHLDDTVPSAIFDSTSPLYSLLNHFTSEHVSKTQPYHTTNLLPSSSTFKSFSQHSSKTDQHHFTSTSATTKLSNHIYFESSTLSSTSISPATSFSFMSHLFNGSNFKATLCETICSNDPGEGGLYCNCDMYPLYPSLSTPLF